MDVHTSVDGNTHASLPLNDKQNMRGQSLKLKKIRTRTGIRAQPFAVQVASDWNNLSEVTDATSAFEQRLGDARIQTVERDCRQLTG